ncbi:Amidase domain containing protein [Asbolus verrucosus]|uniref:Amidase domain containing protein n=1 Tax=Asbolus verrucosus TaxID=1661398 RepID=A0A482W8U6_ASBVE|nr:Amidase domain containing protein [Asbolus verrucosus]
MKFQGNQNFALEFMKSLFGMSNYTYNLLTFYLFQYIFNTFVKNDGYLWKNDHLRQLFTVRISLLGVSYLMIFNSLGLPATHVPCGLDKNGLPIGIQVVAAPYQDRLCFAVAEELEKRFGGWTPPS